MSDIFFKSNFHEDIFQDINKKAEELGMVLNFNKNNMYVSNINESDSLNSIDLKIELEVDIYESNDKYQVFEFTNRDSEFYDGEILAANDLTISIINHYKNNKKYDFGINLAIDLVEQEENMLTLKEFSENKRIQAISDFKNRMSDSENENIFNSERVQDLFVELADGQRNKPEMKMLECQRNMGGGVLSHLLEHVGDLTHRMSERTFVRNNSFESTVYYVKPKVENAINSFQQELPFAEEHKQNMEANYSSYNKGETFEEWNNKINNLAQEYSDLHSELTVYNKLQYAAREAAVELGKMNFDKVVEHLTVIKESIDNGNYLLEASEYVEGGYKPKNKNDNKRKIRIR